MSNYDMQYHLRNTEWRMNDLQNRMGTQSRLKNLRDDPIAAAHSVRLQSRMQRMNQFTKNVETVQGNYRVAETYMRSAVDIVQRIRELAIQGATDTYSREEKQYMAEEVNQLLNELVEIGNARFPDGSTIFSGDRTQTLPFRATYGRVEGTETAVITGLEYVGTIDRGKGEISEQSFIETRFPGNAVLWAEQQQILTPSDVTAYQVKADSSIFVDGREILLSAGDNISAVIAKINDAGLAVKGSLDPADNSLVLTTTVPHQIWLEDGAGGTVLRDLGVLNGFGKPPHNLASDVRVAGGSLFDTIRYVRDSLYNGDTIEIGGVRSGGWTAV
jgi:flagellar hook-associated protein 3 FlgL